MKRENMSRKEIKLLAPHLRILAEDAKKQHILKQSGYKEPDFLPAGLQAFFAILVLITLGVMVGVVIMLF